MKCKCKKDGSGNILSKRHGLTKRISWEKQQSGEFTIPQWMRRVIGIQLDSSNCQSSWTMHSLLGG